MRDVNPGLIKAVKEEMKAESSKRRKMGPRRKDLGEESDEVSDSDETYRMHINNFADMF